MTAPEPTPNPLTTDVAAPSAGASPVAPRYWKSLEERAGDPAARAAAQDEFAAPPPAVATIAVQRPDASKPAADTRRRDFLKVTGFLLAGGLFGGLVRPRVEKAKPYARLLEEGVPGRAYHYAGLCGGCAAGCGILAKVRDGRPVKLEGNPEHPLSRGGLCAVGQASILGLYDSRRATQPSRKGEAVTWSAVDGELQKQFAALTAGGGVRLLTGSQSGPTFRHTVAGFLGRFVDGGHIQYDPLSADSILNAHQTTHGVRLLPRYRLDQADLVVAFDADFLGTWIAPVEFSKAYAGRRTPDTGTAVAGRVPMLRHLHFESGFSLTGARADERHRLHPADTVHALGHLARKIGARSGVAPTFAPGDCGLPDALLENLATELWSARGRSLVLCGVNDPSCQALTNAINAALQNYGTTLDLAHPSNQRLGDDLSLQHLIADMEAGRVRALIVAGCNPVYDLADGARFAKALAQVPLTIACNDRPDETTALCGWHCPEPHWLEAWRDAEPVAGVVVLGQPAIRRIGRTRTLVESLAAWSGAPKNNYALVQDAWRETVYPRAQADAEAPVASPTLDFASFWDRAVQQGFATVASAAPAVREYQPAAIEAPAPKPSGMIAVLYPTVALLDGREANNPWLQELSDPITKTTWEQCASLAPERAAAMGLNDGDKLRITPAHGPAVELPVVLQPGLHSDVVAVPLGYGRLGSDRFATVGPQWISGLATLEPGQRLGQPAAHLALGSNGVNVSRILHAPVTVAATGMHRDLARTQMHHSLREPEHISGPHTAPRPIVREITLAALLKQTPTQHGSATAAAHTGETHTGTVVPAAAAAALAPLHQEPSIWPTDHPYTGMKWGMAVDLNRCTGCAGCVIACQVENNIPVVGWDEVRRGREMAWIRIDRYFADRPAQSDRPAAVDVVHQPMLCQHCDHAPCETVCPVLATVHSSEGINQQVYNRCIGTRYCANNCPYKVRRFNWFGYAHADPLENLVLNPDVTVRSSGVMEKCSFCIQRIQEAKAEAQRAGRPLRDGDIHTACQQSCPADAIVFGNLNDPASKVARLVRDGRAYKVLEEIGTRPAISYLQTVRHRTEQEAYER